MKTLIKSLATAVLTAAGLALIQVPAASAATISPSPLSQVQSDVWQSKVEKVRNHRQYRDRNRRYDRRYDRHNRRYDRRHWRYDRYRHGNRYRHRYGRYRYNYNGWWYATPFWLGAIYSAPAYRPAPGYGYNDHVQYCLNRYRSYNPSTDLFLSYSGVYKRCRSPWRP